MKIIREVWKEIPSEWLFIVFVGGDLFQNRMVNFNRMNYDTEQHCYYYSALIKQGGGAQLRQVDQRPQFIKSQPRLHYIEQKERYLAI